MNNCILCFSMVADEENPLVLNVLHADSTAYSFAPDEEVSEVSQRIPFLKSFWHHDLWLRISLQTYCIGLKPKVFMDP